VRNVSRRQISAAVIVPEMFCTPFSVCAVVTLLMNRMYYRLPSVRNVNPRPSVDIVIVNPCESEQGILVSERFSRHGLYGEIGDEFRVRKSKGKVLI
jgi:hypothetical protein